MVQDFLNPMLQSMGFHIKVTPKVFTEKSFDAAGGLNTLKSAERGSYKIGFKKD